LTQSATSPQRKPLLDETSFQRLLSAAYVLQEHNDSLRAKESQAEVAKNLSAIVETQKLIHSLQLDLTAAAALVAERVQKITNASGSAIGFLEKGQLFYRAGTGTAAGEAGNQVAVDSALSADCLVKNCVLHYSDVGTLSPERAGRFRDQNVKAFIAVPVYHASQIAGVLELRLAGPGSFREADVRTAELMAGLLGEAMATSARMKWKEALASERQSMLEAMERIKPQLERLGSESRTEEEKPAGESPAAAGVTLAAADTPASGGTDRCSVCGSDFFDESESFCGICGAARSVASRLKDQRRLAAPLIVPYADEEPRIEKLPVNRTRREESADLIGTLPASLQELIELCATQTNAAAAGTGQSARSDQAAPAAALESKTSKIAPAEQDSIRTPGPASIFSIEVDDPPTQFQALIEGQAAATKSEELLRIFPAELAPPQQQSATPQPWTSARKAQQWLETVKAEGPAARWLAHQWQRRRANIYIGIAALILVVVISGWGIRPTATGSAAAPPAAFGRHVKPPEPPLTPFERLLVSLGLAEAPPAPVYSGNPDTQVWVDVHTALYYCPGSEFYGKTPDGRLTTQGDAQQDQFEPANRKACP
jgi:GAF domain-containing protein